MARAKIERQRREEILAAFETCVVRQGLASTSLADVAAEAQLPRSLVRYFVGNRDQMVEMLIARMVRRAEAELTLLRAQGKGARTVYDVVEFLFGRIFADETSNAVVSELWYLARRDEEIRVRLEAVYSRAIRELTKELRGDACVRGAKGEVEAVAFALLSLAYGEASFRELGMSGGSRNRVRDLAHDLVATLTGDARSEGRS